MGDSFDNEAGDRSVGPSEIVVDIYRALVQDIRKVGLRNGGAHVVIVPEGVMCVRGTLVNIVFRHLFLLSGLSLNRLSLNGLRVVIVEEKVFY